MTTRLRTKRKMSAYISQLQQMITNIYADLTAGISTSIISITDSTGAAITTWPYLVLQMLAARFTNYTVRYLVWNAGTQNYNSPVYVRGADTDRYILPAVNGATAATGVNIPHADIAGVAGDIDVRVKVRSTNYAIGGGLTQALVGKFTSTSGTKGWRLAITATGQLQFLWSIDGTAQIVTTSTVTLPSVGIANDTDIYLRATLDVDNGASGNTVTYYYSTDGVTWTPLGSPVITATATSIYILNTTQAWEVGVTGSTANVFSGRIYSVEIRDGIGGFIVSPFSIDSWTRYSAGVSFVGPPTLTWFIGGHSGASITYLQDSTRIKTLMPIDNYSAKLLSCGHNDGARQGQSYLTDWDGLVTAINGRLKTGEIIIVTQNPEKSPATSYDAQAKRMGQLVAFAQKNNFKVVDAHNAFVSEDGWQTLIQDVDGIHPTPSGYAYWAAFVYAKIFGN